MKKKSICHLLKALKLPEKKLKALHMDLLLQDKEEIALKKMKSAGLDKDGLKEATLRKSLNAIINKYGLADHFATDEENTHKNQVSSEVPEEMIDKRFFKDKKLNKLWTHVEKSDFSDEELKTLKEEFQHHQEKLNLYHNLLDEINKDAASSAPEEMDNSVETLMREETNKKNSPHTQQMLKKQYHDLRQDYDYLAGKVLKGKGIIFEEGRVNKLWELAQKADFTSSELESLKEELHHYEHRVKKLKFLEAELDFSNERHESKKYVEDKSEVQKQREQRVKDYNYKVNKIHNEIESRILQRHLEL
ncbi:alpha-2-macroglobulin receptor-associated protein-like [Centruroides sculpturatus]|uniref:alpha-2-macroglobulin receptor-associated protein-like n=1 Tax=Centruroides sculpturatus TaxID=218467 RepID=UPI000C6DC40B|nr:alpha-2-macroglobulin receptor-associated protein-like [Centruroides sculpturatus]